MIEPQAAAVLLGPKECAKSGLTAWSYFLLPHTPIPPPFYLNVSYLKKNIVRGGMRSPLPKGQQRPCVPAQVSLGFPEGRDSIFWIECPSHYLLRPLGEKRHGIQLIVLEEQSQ